MSAHQEKSSEEYFIKAYEDQLSVDCEIMACKAMGGVEELAGLVPQCLPRVPTRRVPPLTRLPGEPLKHIIRLLDTAQRRHVRDQIHTILQLLHERACISHGNVRAASILVDDHRTARLVDFDLAERRADVDAARWQQLVAADFSALDEVFNAALSDDAVDAAEALLVDAAFIDDADTQKRLAGYLQTARYPPRSLLHEVIRRVPHPSATLVLRLCYHLRNTRLASDLKEAVRILHQAASAPRHDDNGARMLEVKHALATNAAALELATLDPFTPTAAAAFDQAVAAAAARATSSHDPTLLGIRVDYAVHHYQRSRFEQALDMAADVAAAAAAPPAPDDGLVPVASRLLDLLERLAVVLTDAAHRARIEAAQAQAWRVIDDRELVEGADKLCVVHDDVD